MACTANHVRIQEVALEEVAHVGTGDGGQALENRTSESRDHPSSMRTNAGQGLQASLLQDRDKVLRWVEDNPLRLVAATLMDERSRSAKIADLKAALTNEIIEVQGWDKWWNVVRFGLKKSRHFSYTPRQPVRLRTSNVAEIDSDTLDDIRAASRTLRTSKFKSRETSESAPRIPGLGGWILWVQSDHDEPLPRSIPPAEFVTFLTKLPESVVDVAVYRIIRGIRQRLLESKQRPAEKSSDMWQASLVSALARWSELASPPGLSIQAIVEITAKALDVLGQGAFKDVVKWVAKYTAASDENLKSVTSALLYTSSEAPEGTASLLASLSGSLESSVRNAVWRRLLGLSLTQTDRSSTARWMRLVRQEDKAELLSGLLVDLQDEASIAKLGSLLNAEWRLSESSQRDRLFRPLALAWIMHGRKLPDISSAMAEAMIAVDDNLELEGSLLAEWRRLVLSASEEEVRTIRVETDLRVGNLESVLAEAEGELNRLRRRERFLSGENRAKRATAELEISRDAITILGVALQGLAGDPTPGTKQIRDVGARITLALSTLGAKPFGDVGEIVPFDPVQHETEQPPAEGTPMTVKAPGLQYSRRRETPVYLVKAQVRKVERR